MLWKLHKAWQFSISMTFRALAVFHEPSVGFQSTSFMLLSEPKCNAMPVSNAISAVVWQYKLDKCASQHGSISWQGRAQQLPESPLKSCSIRRDLSTIDCFVFIKKKERAKCD